MIYVKDGVIIDNDKIKIFKLSNGQVINKDKLKINVFEFDEIDFNLADYSANTILVPKIQEMPLTILIKCKLTKYVIYENKRI